MQASEEAGAYLSRCCNVFMVTCICFVVSGVMFGLRGEHALTFAPCSHFAHAFFLQCKQAQSTTYQTGLKLKLIFAVQLANSWLLRGLMVIH